MSTNVNSKDAPPQHLLMSNRVCKATNFYRDNYVTWAYQFSASLYETIKYTYSPFWSSSQSHRDCSNFQSYH